MVLFVRSAILNLSPRAAGAGAAVKARLGGRIPFRMTQCLTWACNLDCSYCARHHSANSELSTGEIATLMRSLRQAGTRYWSFNGGEPLLRPDIGELIAIAKGLGMYVSLNTNGTVISQRLDALQNADLVSISLDGPKEIHDHARGKSYDAIIAGAEALRRRQLRMAFICVIGQHNAHALDHVLAVAKEFSTAVYFQPLRRQKEDINGKALGGFLTQAEMRQTMDWLLRAKKAGLPVASSATYLRAIHDHWPDSLPHERCWAGKMYGFITPDGQVAACCDTLLQALPAKPSALAAFNKIPSFACQTCFASGPLEINIVMNHLTQRALSLFCRHSLSPF